MRPGFLEINLTDYYLKFSKNVMIDSCILKEDSSLLQQASNLTNGFYFKIPQINGLLNYLLWLFLPNESARKILVYPPNAEVDYRAACFCHRKLIDVGYVCSVCLSVFCSFTPICSTCNCNFQFDVDMLKRASSLKQFNFNNPQKQQVFHFFLLKVYILEDIKRLQ